MSTTLVGIELGYKDTTFFSANPTLVLGDGQHLHLSDGGAEFVDAYVIGDGVTQLQNLPWKGIKTTIPPTTYPFTVTGTTVTLPTVPTNVWGYYLNGNKCRVGNGGSIETIVGTLITFDQDYTGAYFEAIY